MKKPFLIAVLLTLATAVTPQYSVAEDFYRWVDKNGVTHFGATPPKGVTAKKMKAHGSKKSARPPTTKKAEAPTAAQLKLQERKKEQCKVERGRLKTLQNTNARIRTTQEDGSIRYLTPEEVDTELKNSQAFIKDVCS